MASERLALLSNVTGAGKSSGDDVVIISAVRTPLSRAKKGPLKDLHQEDLLAAVLKGVVARVKLNPGLVDDIIVGNVCPPGGGATVSRMAMLYAGFPDKTSIATVNRQCSSGLQAVASIAAAIQAGQIDIGIGAGVEQMTMNYGPQMMPTSNSEEVMALPAAANCLMPMGITSENVAEKYHVSREDQDRFAAASHQKAAAAHSKGLFKEEIIPIKVKVADKNGNEKTINCDFDDGIRPETTFEVLSKLKPAFKKNGSTTAGNASQVTDGAAAVLLMKRSTAQKLGLKPLAKFVSFASVGVPPEIMGTELISLINGQCVGPAFAIPVALKKAGLTVRDIDIYEINEAFASQALFSIQHLGIDINKVNPKGGAIALGHPLGCTGNRNHFISSNDSGARQIATLLPELKRRNARYGVTSMCIGTGMGAAAVIEREP